VNLVFLHGAAAAGKLTTAQSLAERLGYPVFHNHLTVDLVTTVFSFGSAQFQRLREFVWKAVFAEAADAGRSLIFTFTPESTVTPGFPERVRTVITDAGGQVRFVKLTVSQAEQERRITAESRRKYHKLVDLETLRTLRNRQDTVDQPPADLEIDTDASGPSDSAVTIIEHFGLPPERPVSRYPLA
jgi:AAA domain-containing protein